VRGFLVFLKSRTVKLLFAGALAGALLLSLFAKIVVATSSYSFCMSCHEMRVVAEQGWMKSPHYQNEHGVVAECSNCHVEPELIGMLWTKTRDGLTDIWVHNTGESDPYKMDWERLTESARAHIKDSSCKRCHSNILAAGGNIKMFIAHKAYERMDGRKKCVDCHQTEFHAAFKEYLFGSRRVSAANGGKK